MTTRRTAFAAAVLTFLIGAALTLSPLHTELYYQAARQVLDRALVE